MVGTLGSVIFVVRHYDDGGGRRTFPSMGSGARGGIVEGDHSGGSFVAKEGRGCGRGCVPSNSTTSSAG